MPQVVLLLPGQGAQAVGMGKAFYDKFPEARDVYKRANTHLGFDVTALCFEGPADDLTKTEKCQPALFVTSYAAWTAFQRVAPQVHPIGVAGLSLGELTALAVAGAMRLTDALYLVQARGDAMAECAAHNQGAMLAVLNLAPDALKSICEESGATIANYNTQDQVVLSGTVEEITRAEELAKARGAKRAIRLEVAGAFHSSLMQPAATKFSQVIGKVRFSQPLIPVISNVTAQPIEKAEDIANILVQQIVSPVLWEPSMRYLIGQGATHFIEFPPSRVLTGMLRKIDARVKGYAVDEPADFEQLSDIAPMSIPA